MGIIGNLNENSDYVSKHVDKGNLVTALLHVGNSFKGSGIKYYTGVTRESIHNLAKEIPYVRGQLNIGCFEKILHSEELQSSIQG